jgi:Domain of unknown function (DUF4198)
MRRFGPCWLALLCVLPVAVQAHDTWIDATHRLRSGSLLRMGTGNQFPKMETGLVKESLALGGCDSPDGAAQPLPVLTASTDGANTPALTLLAPPAARQCWAQLQPFDIQIAPNKVAVYLKEIQAAPALRAAWADLQQRGRPWRERYTKHARIVLARTIDAAASAAPRAMADSRGPAPAKPPVVLGMDLHFEPGVETVWAGAPFTVQVLRDGLPLADQAIELRGDTSPHGFWRKSDALGRLQFTAPLPGRWLLRGTDLRLSAQRPGEWDSRFVTLAFEVLARPSAAD